MKDEIKKIEHLLELLKTVKNPQDKIDCLDVIIINAVRAKERIHE